MNGTAEQVRVVERCGVAIARRDEVRRVVYGEVMLPAPRIEPGQLVREEDLRGLIHFDGGHMVAAEIETLVDRFAAKRPAVDVEHDGTPRSATVVESFLAGDDWKPWVAGAWVAGVQLHDEALWSQVERAELDAFSIQFIVRVRDITVKLQREDGSVVQTVLHEFSDAIPQFLSLVKNPATGAHWKVHRHGATRARQLPVVDREWVATQAAERVRSWSEGRSIEDCLSAYAVAGPSGGRHQIADVVDGRLVVVRSALAEAAMNVDRDADLSGPEARRVMGQLQQHSDRATVPFQDLPLADEGRQWDASAATARVREWAGGDDWAPEKYRRAFVWYDSADPELLGSYKLPVGDVVDGSLTAVPRAVFAAAQRLDQTDIPDADKARVRSHLRRYYDKMDREPPWEGGRSDEQARDAEPVTQYVFVDGALVEATPEHVGPRFVVVDGKPQQIVYFDDDEDTVSTDDAEQGETGHTEQDESEQDSAAVEPEGGGEGAPAPPTEVEPATEPEAEVTLAVTFGDTAATHELVEDLWQGGFVLYDTAQQIASSGATLDDMRLAMAQAIADFASWALGQVDQLGVVGFAPADSLFGRTAESVERAGKKMAKARLKRLKDAVALLSDLVAELDDGEESRSEERRAAVAVSTLPSMDQLLAPVVEQLGTIGERLEAIERARPMPAAAGGSATVTRTVERTSREIVRDALFGR